MKHGLLVTGQKYTIVGDTFNKGMGGITILGGGERETSDACEKSSNISEKHEN